MTGPELVGLLVLGVTSAGLLAGVALAPRLVTPADPPPPPAWLPVAAFQRLGEAFVELGAFWRERFAPAVEEALESFEDAYERRVASWAVALDGTFSEVKRVTNMTEAELEEERRRIVAQARGGGPALYPHRPRVAFPDPCPGGPSAERERWDALRDQLEEKRRPFLGPAVRAEQGALEARIRAAVELLKRGFRP